MEEFPSSEIDAAFAIDYLESSRPISFEVRNSDEIRQAFDGISYSKGLICDQKLINTNFSSEGASIIRMAQHILGEDTFKKGLIKYLTDHKYSNVNHENLWDALTIQAHEDNVLDANLTLKEIMDTWTLQPGFPVVSVKRNGINVTVSQVRFFSIGINGWSFISRFMPGVNIRHGFVLKFPVYAIF